MTPEKLKAALNLCIVEITAELNPGTNNIPYIPARFPTDKIPQTEIDILSHAWWMAEEAKKFVNGGCLEKAHQWLGFIRACIWCCISTSVDGLRDTDKPDEAPPVEDFEEGCTHHMDNRSGHE